jgi:hypothetical protein
MKLKFNLSKIFLCIFCLTLFSHVHAQGLFDTILKSFYSTGMDKWYPKAQTIAAGIFWTVSLLEFGYLVAFKKMFAGQIDKLWYVIISRAIITSLLFAIFVNDIKLYTGIIEWLLKIGSDFGGGLSKTPGADIVSVSDLFDKMWNALLVPLKIIFVGAAGAGILSPATGIFLFSIAGIIILTILIASVAVMWMVAKAWIVIFGGFILTGFIGSNWTRNYWQKYLSYVIGVGFSLFGLSLVIVMITAQWSNLNWLPALPDINIGSFATDAMGVIGQLFLNLVSILGVLIFDVVLLIGAPMIGSQLASGVVNAGMGDLIAGAATAASGGAMLGKTAQAATKAAGAAASGVTGAAGAGKKAAIQSMRDSLKNGISGGNSDDGAFRDMAKTKAKEAASSASKEHRSQGFSDAKDAFKEGMKNTSREGSKFGQHASRASGGGSTSGASVNTNSPQG